MKKRDYFVMGTIIVCSALFGALFGHFFFDPVHTSGAPGDDYEIYQLAAAPEVLQAYTETEVVEEPNLPSHKYVVTVQDGYIVVFYAAGADKASQIKTVTNTSVAALPPEEQERLTHGINVYSEDILFRILEDYGS